MPKYELAVIGAGLGGLAAAALAARQGRRTIVLEPGDTAGGVVGAVHSDGFAFSPGPHLSFGFERDGILQAIGERLGVALHASLCSPCYQVALPDRRITIYAEHSETLEELSREFPLEIDRIARFYRELRAAAVKSAKSRVSAFFLSRRSARGFIRHFRFGREFSAFLDVQALVFFRRRAVDLPLSCLITLCDTAPYAVPDGFTDFAGQMVDVILKNDGEIFYQVPLSGIILNRGRITGVSTPTAVLDAATVLLNTEHPGLMKNEVIFLAIRDVVVPVGMLQNVICLADYEKPEDIFTLSVSAKNNEMTAPRGMSTLTACFISGPSDRSGAECQRLIGTIIPFLNDFVVLSGKHTRAPRIYSLPEGSAFKAMRIQNGPALLGRSSPGDVYLLGDGSGTPAQEIAAAKVLVDRLK